MDTIGDSTDDYETDDWLNGGDDSSEDELVAGDNKNKGTQSKKSGHVNNNNKNKDAAAAVGKKKHPLEVSKAAEKNKGSDEDSASSDDVYESKQGAATSNKSKRGAFGMVNDHKSSTKTDNNNSIGEKDSDDASDGSANSGDSDDDDDDDSDDLGLGLGSNKQSQAAKSRKRAAMMQQMYDSSSSSDDSDDDDSSDDTSIDANKKRKQNNTSGGKKPKTAGQVSSARKKKQAIALDTSSDSDNSDDDDDCVVDVTSTAKSKRVPAVAKAKASSEVAIDCMSSDSDEDKFTSSTRQTNLSSTPSKKSAIYKSEEPQPMINHDPSVRANSNATLEAAKRARAALLQSQVYHAEDVAVPSLPSQIEGVRPSSSSPAVLDLESNDFDTSATSQAISNAPSTAASYTGAIITMYLRYRDTLSNKESKVNMKIKMDQPLQHLVDEFQFGKITQIKFDGQNLDLTKTPSFYEMDDEDLVDAVVTSTKVVIHVRSAGIRNETYQMKKSDPLEKLIGDYCKKNQLSTIALEYNGRKLDTSQSCAQLNIPNDSYLDALVAGGTVITLIFRVNGKVSETERISIRMKETFQLAMESFAQRRNVTVSQCKFVFDGEVLRSLSTPEQLDLEGGEIIDVSVAESVPQQRAITNQRTATAAVSVAAAGAAAAAPVMITVETNRNQNNNPRQKKWKLLNTSSIAKLKTDYCKYYKSKGCKSVQFYFRNTLIQDESNLLRDLGIGDGDTVYAMENGKAFTSR
jgi:hypothetical protein